MRSQETNRVAQVEYKNTLKYHRTTSSNQGQNDQGGLIHHRIVDHNPQLGIQFTITNLHQTGEHHLVVLDLQLGEGQHPGVPHGAIAVGVGDGSQVPVLLEGGKHGEVCKRVSK